MEVTELYTLARLLLVCPVVTVHLYYKALLDGFLQKYADHW